jgi:hypothetical protein
MPALFSLNKCLFHQSKFEVYCVQNSIRAALFPVTSDCFSFEFRWILNCVLLRVGLMGAVCNILNAYKKGKYPHFCWVRGSLMERRASCVPDIAETSVYLNRYQHDVVSSYRISFRKYCVTSIKEKFSNKCYWNVTDILINGIIKW